MTPCTLWIVLALEHEYRADMPDGWTVAYRGPEMPRGHLLSTYSKAVASGGLRAVVTFRWECCDGAALAQEMGERPRWVCPIDKAGRPLCQGVRDAIGRAVVDELAELAVAMEEGMTPCMREGGNHE